MARDISRKRNEIGSSNKTAPNVEDPIVQSAINKVFDEINELYKSVNKVPIAASNTPSDGKEGDVRLSQKTASDGSIGYFISGKFGDSWASGRLGVDLIDPELPEQDQVAVSYVADGGSYITKDGVTFENLNSNGDVGDSENQVAVGNHTHVSYETHIADTSIHFTLADIPTTATVSNTASQGGATTAARSDHVHELNTGVTYEWTARQYFNTGNDNLAIEVNGDLKITGDLIVDYAATEDGNGNANIDGNVILNQADTGSLFTDSYTTTINGLLTANNNTIIKHPGGQQLSLRYNDTNKLDISVGSSGTATLTSNAGIVINANGVDPESTITTDLGSLSKKWKAIHAGELVVENLVAQDVMATIGGRIMVAPTTKLFSQLEPASVGEQPPPHTSTMDTVDNIFDVNDIAFLQTAPGGIAQVEAVKITQYNGQTPAGAYRYTVERNTDGSGPAAGNTWEIDTAIVNLGHQQGDGFIDITSTSGIYSSSGPHIAIHARGANDSGWNIPEVVRLGNLNGSAGYTTNKYGLVVGQNITSSEENLTTPFKGMKATDEGIGVFNTAITHQKGSSKKFFVGSDPRTGYDNEVVFALGDGITWNNDVIQNANLVWQKGGDGNYGLTLSNADINLQITENDILGALDWMTNDNTPSNTGFYVTPNYLGFYSSNQWRVKLGAGTGGTPYFSLGDPSSSNSASFEYDGTDLTLNNVDIKIEAPGYGNDVGIHIGQNIANQGTASQDDIIIGSWAAQSNSDQGASADRKGLLIKHGWNDWTTLNHNGLRRRGSLAYPNIIYSGFHWGGPVNLNGVNNGNIQFGENYFDYAVHSTFGSNTGLGFITKENKISVWWGYDKTTVPYNRKLIWTFQPNIYKTGWGSTSNDAWTNNSVRSYRFWGAGGDADSVWGGDGGGDEYQYDFCFIHYEDTYDAGYNDHTWVDDNYNVRGWGNTSNDNHYRYNGYHIPSYLKGNLNKSVSFGIIPPGTNVSNLWLIAGRAGNRSELSWESHCFGGIIQIMEVDA